MISFIPINTSWNPHLHVASTISSLITLELPLYTCLPSTEEEILYGLLSFGLRNVISPMKLDRQSLTHLFMKLLSLNFRGVPRCSSKNHLLFLKRDHNIALENIHL